MTRDDSLQTELLRLQVDLHTHLRGVNDARKVLVYGLRAAAKAFNVSEGALATLRSDRTGADLLFIMPKDGAWDEVLLTGYLLDQRPAIEPDILLAPIRRRGRNWAVLALRGDAESFEAEHLKALFSVAQTLTDIILQIDRERVDKVRRKLELKVANRADPKDLMYDILHGFRSLTNYDHSASLLIKRAGSTKLELVAEQIAWTKAKSMQIGRRLRLDEALCDRLKQNGVYIYRRDGEVWQPLHAERNGDAMPGLPELLSHTDEPASEVPAERVMLCALVSTPDGTSSVLKLAARRSGVLGDYEVALVDEFLPMISLVIQFSRQIESLREQVLQAERKHVLADLARATAHDVNHALGIMLPRVQELRHDIRDARLELDVLEDDLRDIEHAVQTCRRIFEGMLAIARGSSRSLGNGSLPRAVEHALSVLQDSMKRKSIEVEVNVSEELPAIRGRQGDLTQLFLNLCGNAIDAMPGGGRLNISAGPGTDGIQVNLTDTGHGIPEDVKHRVMEAFFSTKENGSGLGLAICRSILREIGGKMEIESEEGKGTCVVLNLPYLEEQMPEAA